MTDKRLLGTWKSDARATLRELRKRGDLKPKQLEFLAAMFGKLEVRYTRTRCYTNYKDYSNSCRYRVIGKDSDSVAIISDCTIAEEERIQHIRFEGQRYWIEVGLFREWFKKIR